MSPSTMCWELELEMKMKGMGMGQNENENDIKREEVGKIPLCFLKFDT